MKSYLKNQKVIERKPRSKLVKVALTCGLIGTIGLISYLTNSHDESVFEKRARYLNIANEQMLQTQDPETINGLNSVIKDIENGVYDYSK